MSAQESLRRMKALIDAPEKWTKLHYARSSTGSPVPMNSLLAVCFCVSGARRRANAVPDVVDYIRAAIRELPAWKDVSFVLIPEWNDHPNTTHAEVIQVLDRAIELAAE